MNLINTNQMLENINLIETIRYLLLIFGSGITAFVIATAITPYFIKFLHKNKLGKQIRETSAGGDKAHLFRKLHLKKSGTPTMGGVLIWGVTILVVLISIFLAPPYLDIINHSLLNRQETYLPIFTLLAAAFLGLVDDYFNIRNIGGKKGISIKPKLFWLTLLGVLGGLWFHYKLGYDQIHIPGVGDIALGWIYIVLFALVIIATANAVNFTDGLDGLAGGLLIIAFGSFAVIAYLEGLLILSAFCATLMGASLAFLWFNIPPAKFMMGDTGSLSLGATLGVIAMLTDSIAVLPLIGFIFVIEALSVIIQLVSKKLFKKKVFTIAPIHHHFENKGWSESTIVMRFWILGAIFATFGLIIGLLSHVE